jgi:DNA invertase Pin-like site-specific DNA recombinase
VGVKLVVNKEEVMNLEETIKYYGSIKNLADAIGVSRQTIYLWKAKDAIPYARQAQIEIETRGKLKAEQ